MNPVDSWNMWPGFPDSFYVFSLVIIPSTFSTLFPSLDDSSEHVMQLHKKPTTLLSTTSHLPLDVMAFHSSDLRPLSVKIQSCSFLLT